MRVNRVAICMKDLLFNTHHRRRSLFIILCLCLVIWGWCFVSIFHLISYLRIEDCSIVERIQWKKWTSRFAMNLLNCNYMNWTEWRQFFLFYHPFAFFSRGFHMEQCHDVGNSDSSANRCFGKSSFLSFIHNSNASLFSIESNDA